MQEIINQLSVPPAVLGGFLAYIISPITAVLFIAVPFERRKYQEFICFNNSIFLFGYIFSACFYAMVSFLFYNPHKYLSRLTLLLAILAVFAGSVWGVACCPDHCM